MKLSDRVRPNSEAAAWVVEEIKKLEEALSDWKANYEEVQAELDAKRKNGHMIVEHGYRIAAEQEARKLHLENTILKRKLEAKESRVEVVESALAVSEARLKKAVKQRNEYIHGTDFRRELGDLNEEFTYPEILKCDRELNAITVESLKGKT